MERKDDENILIQDENRPDLCVQCKYLGNALYEASLTGIQCSFTRLFCLNDHLRYSHTLSREIILFNIQPIFPFSIDLIQIQIQIHIEL